MFVPVHIQAALEAVFNDEEELLLDIYFEINDKNTTEYMRNKLKEDYNVPVDIINTNDPLKNYRRI